MQWREGGVHVFALGSSREGYFSTFFPEPYTHRDVRLHVQRLKDLLSTNPLQQSMLSSDGLTLSFLFAITSLDPNGMECNMGEGRFVGVTIEWDHSVYTCQLRCCVFS